MVAVAASPNVLRLFPRQMRFVQDPAPFVAMTGGIGSGKSLSGAAKVVARLDRRELGGVYAPTYPMLRDATMRTLMGMFDDLGVQYHHQKTENIITIPATGHEILCRSLDNPDTLRGPNLAYAWIDEAAYISPDAWRIVKGRVRVGDHRQVWATFTPKGRNFLWEEFERDADEDHKLYRVRTEENPELPAGFSQSLGYAGQFAAQELGGEFVAFEGLVYPMFNRTRQVRIVDTSGWGTVLGLDLGTRNPTALLVVRYAGERRHYEHEHYERGMSSDSITDLAVKAWETYQPEYMVVDPSAAGLILSLEARGVRVRKAVNDVMVGISNLSSVMDGTMPDGESQLSVDPSCIHFIAEAESYRYPDGRRGNSDSPIKENDHLMDTARYVEMELSAPPRKWGLM